MLSNDETANHPWNVCGLTRTCEIPSATCIFELKNWSKGKICRGDRRSPLRRSTQMILGGSTITSEAIASERINTVDLEGGLRWLTQSQMVLWVYLDASWVILSAVPLIFRYSVFTSCVKFVIYLQKSKEDRLVYNSLVKIEHYYECEMFLRDTCKRNKLNLLNSTSKMVKVDCWSSLWWSLICPLDQQCWSFQRQLPQRWLLIPQDQQCWSSLRWSLRGNHLWDDHWSVPSPGSTVLILSEVITSETIIDPQGSMVLILSEVMIIDPQDQQRWLPLHVKVKSSLFIPSLPFIDSPSTIRM